MHKLTMVAIAALLLVSLLSSGCADMSSADAVDVQAMGLSVGDVDNELYSQWNANDSLYTMHSFDIKGTNQRFGCVGTFRGAVARGGCNVDFDKDGLFQGCTAPICVDSQKRA